jgi:hypothetical protein
MEAKPTSASARDALLNKNHRALGFLPPLFRTRGPAAMVGFSASFQRISAIVSALGAAQPDQTGGRFRPVAAKSGGGWGPFGVR